MAWLGIFFLVLVCYTSSGSEFAVNQALVNNENRGLAVIAELEQELQLSSAESNMRQAFVSFFTDIYLLAVVFE